MMMIKQICYFLASLLVVLSTYEPPVACHELAVADIDETVAEHFLSRILAVSAKRVTNMRTRTTKATKATKAAKAAKATKKVNKNSKKTKKTKKAKAAKTTKAKAAKKTTKKINATVVCGVPKITPITNGMKIVGGVNAIAGSIPWQASLVIDNSEGSFMCGGTLIDAQWIVTAGHCAASGDQVTVYLGIYNYSDTYSTGKGTIITASKVIRHPKFNGNIVTNDITLVKLSKAVTFTDKILPACLPTSDNATVGRAGMISGWGLTKNNGDISDPLMQAVIPIQKLSWCGFSDTSVKLQICAGSSKPTKDTCQGDSGGPLTLTNNGKSFDLVGITSYGGPCNGKGIYTRVYGYISWIKSTMAAN